MMRYCPAVVALVLLSATAARAGRLSMGSSVSVHYRHGKTRLMLGVSANYRLSPRWTVRGGADAGKWDGYFYLPVSASLIGHLVSRGPLLPYLGAGLNATFWPGRDNGPDPTMGYHAIAGLRVHLGGKLSAHVEGRYLVDDFSEGDGSWTWGTGASGAIRWVL
jgi:hypothetical protein